MTAFEWRKVQHLTAVMVALSSTGTKRAFSILQSETSIREAMGVNYHYRCFSNKGCDTLS